MLALLFAVALDRHSSYGRHTGSTDGSGQSLGSQNMVGGEEGPA